MTIGFDLEASNPNLLQYRYLSKYNIPSVIDLFLIGCLIARYISVNNNAIKIYTFYMSLKYNWINIVWIKLIKLHAKSFNL